MESARKRGSSRATVGQALVLAIVMLAGMSAAPDAQAKKPPTACDGIAGAPRGLCVAAERLGCAVPGGRHQKQCDVLMRNFLRVTGLTPPWMDPGGDPGTYVTLTVDAEVFDIDASDAVCAMDDTGPGGCNEGEPGFVNAPNDIAFVSDPVLQTVVATTTACGAAPFNAGAFVLPESFEAVVWDASYPDLLDFASESFVLGSGDTLVLQTCIGNVYKIGNLFMSGSSMTVQYELIHTAN